MTCPWCSGQLARCQTCHGTGAVTADVHAAFMAQPYLHRGRAALFGDGGAVVVDWAAVDREDAERQERRVVHWHS